MRLNLMVVGTLSLRLVTSIPFISPEDPSNLEDLAPSKFKNEDGRNDNDRHVIHVQAGQRIQDAINAASPGNQILIEAGTYFEQLVIKKNGIALVGHDAVLTPPPTAVQNECSGLAGPGTQAGICVIGPEVELADFVVEHRKVLSVGDPVKDTSITGFQVSNFGLNIAVVGAQNARVSKNRLTDGEVYGLLTAGSSNTLVTANTVESLRGLPFVGICMDNMAGIRVSNNHISGYNIALCVQTSGADVRQNNVRNNCIGAYVDPGVVSAKVHDNKISATNPSCAAGGSLGTYGVIVGGAVNTEVRDNVINGQINGGLAVGLAIVDDPCTVPGLSCIYRNNAAAIASGNVAIQNTLFNNDLDILVDTNGTGNVIKKNKCSTSKPEGLCVRRAIRLS